MVGSDGRRLQRARGGGLFRLLFFSTLAVLLGGCPIFEGSSGRSAYKSVQQDALQMSGYETADIRLGAQLYDDWPRLKKEKFGTEHPLYPRKRGNKTNTWRCKECHGWDYLGSDGRYGQGSHFTGIRGVFAVRGESPETLYRAIAEGGSFWSHWFKRRLDDEEVWALVKFIREGLGDIEGAIGPDGGLKGNFEEGRTLYEGNCASCHGEKGDLIDLRKSKEGKQGLGGIVLAEPEMALHRTRWGKPRGKMPSALTDLKLTERQIIHILTYCARLP